MRIKRIHHVTVAVRDVDGARLTFEQLFGQPASGTAADVPAFGVRTVDLPFGETTLQLAAPVDADNPVLRYLERRGEGFYNIALEVEDLDGAVSELAAQGVRVSAPLESEPGMRSAFIAMAATHGLSVQLVEVVGASVRQGVSASGESASVRQGVGASGDEAAASVADEPVGAPAAATESSDEALAAQAPLDLTPDEWSDTD